jgi:predicted nucleotidyltransferase
VLSAVRTWAAVQTVLHPELVRLGVFGSYARGDQGVGSDVDLVAVVRTASVPPFERARAWATEELPVPADLLIYTEDEWRQRIARGDRFARVLDGEVVWVLETPRSR